MTRARVAGVEFRHEVTARLGKEPGSIDVSLTLDLPIPIPAPKPKFEIVVATQRAPRRHAPLCRSRKFKTFYHKVEREVRRYGVARVLLPDGKVMEIRR